MVARYEPVLVTRTPQLASAPVFTEIDEIVPKQNLAWSDELHLGGAITFSIDPQLQPETVRNGLRDIAQNPLEVYLYRDGTLVQAGPIIGVQAQGTSVNIIARGILYYLRYMYITSDLEYDTIDQYTIAKGLVDHWQNKIYGNFGIDTSGIGTSGTTRSINYFADEAPMVFAKLTTLADNDSGFEFYIDPTTRDLILTGRKGSDKSADIILDSRAIPSPNAYFSVAAGDYANHAIAIGADQEATTPVVSTKTDMIEMGIWGRAGHAMAIDGVSTQLVVDDYAQAMVDMMDRLHVIPGPASLFPVEGADVMDFESGDSVTWDYDYGLGRFTSVRDVWKKWVKVDSHGQETMTVEFI